MEKDLTCFPVDQFQGSIPGDTRRTWKQDKKWSDRFLPQIKQILGLYLICEAPEQDDAEKNTDLIILKFDSVRIVCRIRKYEYFEKYGKQFTIRSKRYSENKTELSKIIEGYGDYFFYGFSNQEESNLYAWHLIDLKKFRLCFMRKLYQQKELGQQRRNRDNSSDFIAFDYGEFPEDLVIARG